MRERGLSADDDLSYLREYEHITLARDAAGRSADRAVAGRAHRAVRLLHVLLPAAEDGGGRGSVIEILVLQALAHQAQGDVPAALAALRRALALAEPEGYVRIFVDEGAPMAALLQGAAQQGTARTPRPPPPGAPRRGRGDRCLASRA